MLPALNLGNTPSPKDLFASGKSAIDELEWGRRALEFIEISVPSFQQMEAKLTSMVAFEVVLLAVAKKCEKEPLLWDHARRMGIPWRMKSWTNMTRLQKSYNDAVSNPLHILPKNSLLSMRRSIPFFGPSEQVSKTTKEMQMGSPATDCHRKHS